ncbi:MAG: vWA domain-containing protein, partial [Bacteroidota bacterium]
LIPLLVYLYIRNYHRRQAPVRYSSLGGISTRKPWRVKFYPLLFGLRMLALALLLVAMARPQTSNRRQDISVEGIDIMITMDISSSMLATDFRPNRLEAAKNVAKDFVSGRKNDRLGLVLFSGEAFAQCPLTTDLSMVNTLLEEVSTGMLEDGTAIGDGLATAAKRLKDSEAVSKVVILLTDGVNNLGSIDPSTAAEMAEIYGIRVYTIGVGSNGTARMPVGRHPVTGRYVFRSMEVEIDEETLRDISELTNGQYFRATNKEKLAEIYDAIDKLERSKIEVMQYERKHEEFLWFALIAAFALIVEFLLRKTVFQTIP